MFDKRFYKLIGSMVLSALQIAAQPQSWDNVKSIMPGTEIRVNGPLPGARRGTLKSATEDSVVLNSRTGEETFSRQQVKGVSVKTQGHRRRNTLIGLGVGAVAGLAVGLASDAKCTPSCFLGNNIGKTIFTPIGGILGALIGLLIPSGGWREIYKQ